MAAKSIAKTSAIRAKSRPPIDENELLYDARAQIVGAHAILFKDVDYMDDEEWAVCRLLDRAVSLLDEVVDPAGVRHD